MTEENLIDPREIPGHSVVDASVGTIEPVTWDLLSHSEYVAQTGISFINCLTDAYSRVQIILSEISFDKDNCEIWMLMGAGGVFNTSGTDHYSRVEQGDVNTHATAIHNANGKAYLKITQTPTTTFLSHPGSLIIDVFPSGADGYASACWTGMTSSSDATITKTTGWGFCGTPRVSSLMIVGTTTFTVGDYPRITAAATAYGVPLAALNKDK